MLTDKQKKSSHNRIKYDGSVAGFEPAERNLQVYRVAACRILFFTIKLWFITISKDNLYSICTNKYRYQIHQYYHKKTDETINKKNKNKMVMVITLQSKQ